MPRRLTTIFGGIRGGYSGDGGPGTSAGLSQPAGLAVDTIGNVYVSDYLDNVVRKWTAGTGYVTTVAGSATSVGGYSGDGGPATSARLNKPSAIAIDADNNIYIADYIYPASVYAQSCIRRISINDSIVDTVVGVCGAKSNVFSGDATIVGTSARVSVGGLASAQSGIL